MPLDPTIPLGVTQPDLVGSIGKWGQLGLLKNQIALSNATLQPSIDKATADAQHAQADASVATATVNPRVSQAQSAAGTAATQLSAQRAATMRAHVANAISVASSLANDPTVAGPKATGKSAESTILSGITGMVHNSDAPPGAMEQALAGFPKAKDGAGPADYQKWLASKLASAADTATQLDKQYPAVGLVNTGGKITPMAQGGLAAVTTPGTVVGPETAQTLPATATTVATPGAAPTYVGGSAQGGAPGTVPAGNPAGTLEAVQGRVAPNVTHFASVQSAAAAAPQRITQLQEIKALAPEAMTGDATTMRTILSKLAGYAGIEIGAASQTKTDELAKATALLMDRAGATDAAREVAAMATPNYKMTKEAINNVSNALIGMEKRNLAASSYFNGVPQDSPEYGQRLQTWNNIPARDKAFMVLSMPADEKMALAQKTRGTQQGKDIAAGIRAIEALRLK